MQIRVYGQKKDNVWALVSLDMNLAAQDKELDYAIAKLYEQVKDFVDECFRNKATGMELLLRKAPIEFYWYYYRALIVGFVYHRPNEVTFTIDYSKDKFLA